MTRNARSGPDLRDRELHRTVAEDLQDERAFELDVGVHEDTGRHHLAEQPLHGLGQRPIGARTTRQHFAPAVVEPDQDAAHGQPVEKESMQFAQGRRVGEWQGGDYGCRWRIGA